MAFSYPIRAHADVAAASARVSVKRAKVRRESFIPFLPGNAKRRAGFIRP
jgi:hypothetical protein